MRCDRFQGGACPLDPPAPRGSDPSRPGMLCRRKVAAHSVTDRVAVSSGRSSSSRSRHSGCTSARVC